MQLHCFGSGSRGNAFLLRIGEVSLLIDAGLPPTTLRSLLHRCDIGDHGLTAIIITHEHHDHVRGLKPLLNRQSCSVWATRGTHRALGLERQRCAFFVPGEWLDFGIVGILPVPVSHDANEPIGLRLSAGSVSVAVFTDLGLVTPEVRQALEDAHLIVLEANHDQEMLAQSSYPYWLKARITSALGHLDNEAAARALAAVRSRPQEIWLAHLSEENNHPDLALSIVRRHLRQPDVTQLVVLPQRGQIVSWQASREETPRTLPLPFKSSHM